MDEEKYEYAGEGISVRYDVNRCIHVRACVEGLPEVFDADARPWIDPDAADLDSVARVVMDCPTDALGFERVDGGSGEPVPERNRIVVASDGPLHLHGDLSVETPDGETLLTDARIALCRCGSSGNTPLCDGSHDEAGFEDRGTIGSGERVTDREPPSGSLVLTPVPGGPVELSGSFGINGTDGDSYSGTETALCRYGASGEKPFCDGSHREVGFTGEDTGGRNRTGEDRVS
ncbi:CDGSH iron-sulfur domain-containing protein [Natronorarus salvus]|uniref:CDGSH iron-sulfur domain-containing protein n=1 Tax=Natronorarus salvus TaxID=3117733 RepID=UPI002F25FC46